MKHSLYCSRKFFAFAFNESVEISKFLCKLVPFDVHTINRSFCNAVCFFKYFFWGPRLIAVLIDNHVTILNGVKALGVFITGHTYLAALSDRGHCLYGLCSDVLFHNVYMGFTKPPKALFLIVDIANYLNFIIV